MNRLTYEELNQNIPDEEYRNYHIVIRSTNQEYSFRNFMNDMDALYSGRYPSNCILQQVKRTTAKPDDEIIIQKIVIRPATDLGLEDLEGFGYQDYEDFAVFSIKNEYEMLQQISIAVEQLLDNAVKCFGKNDPVY